MKMTTYLVLSVCLTVCSPLQAADNPHNDFSGPLEVHEGPQLSVENDDSASPFTESHLVESFRYNSFYKRYYGVPSEIGDPVLAKLPEARDKDGHPLWFDGPGGARELSAVFASLFWQSNFSDLDRLYRDWSDPNNVMADGRPQIGVFIGIAGILFSNPTEWEASYQIVQRWRHAEPRSAAAALVEALYWEDYAWDARGTTVAAEVTETGWRLFKERLLKARAVLRESAGYAKGIAWFRTMIDVERLLGVSRERLFELLAEGRAIQPDSYNLDVGILTSLMPRWGGNWRDVDAFVRSSAPSDERKAKESYARSYWFIYKYSPENIFETTLAQWPEMKLGFEEMRRNNPHSGWLVNSFAVFACMAKDDFTYRNLRKQLGSTLMSAAWPSNYSVDLCDNQSKGKEL